MAAFSVLRINGNRIMVPTTGTPGAVVIREASGKVPGITGGTASGEVLVCDQSGASLQSPTLITPTIASLANANHSHQSAAGGGTLDGAAIASGTIDIARLGTTQAPTFSSAVVAADAGLAVTVSRASTNSGGPQCEYRKLRGTHASPTIVAAGDVLGNILFRGWDGVAVRTGANLTAVVKSGVAAGSMPTDFIFQTTPNGAIIQVDVFAATSTRNLAIIGGSTSSVLDAATADRVAMSCVDNGTANGEWQCQPEKGGQLAFGDNHLRIVNTAKRKVEHALVAASTTNATQTTIHTTAIPTDATVVITSTFVARRTGGTAGSAGDFASYVRRATYVNISGTVSCKDVSSVPQNIGNDVEAQAGWDASLTISGTNVLERVTGAIDNNIDWVVESVAVFVQQ